MTAALNTSRKPVDHENRDLDALDRYLVEISRDRLLTDVEEQSLAVRARNGDSGAEHELVAHNLRFVVAIAKQYQHRGLGLDDLVAEGNVGLLAAAHRFKPEHNVRFITYAVWWIRQAILIALTKQVRIVRIPSSRLAKNARLSRVRNLLRRQLGHEPTLDEIAREANVDPQEAHEWHDLQSVQVSLDSTPTDVTERALGEQIAAEPETDSEEESQQASVIESAFEALHPREAQILRSYFGLGGNTPRTLDDVAAEMKITRERVRQIRDRAIGRLRYGKHAAALFSLVHGD